MAKARAEYLRKTQQDLEAISSGLDDDVAAHTRAAVRATTAQSVIAAITVREGKERSAVAE